MYFDEAIIPHFTTSFMDQNKNSDFHISDKRPKKLSKPLQLIILVCLGIIFILCSIIVRNQHQQIILADLLNSLGNALIIGPALSWILDLPSMINYFKRITVNSLISREYLSSLPRNTLLELRKECTEKIHLKDSDRIEKGLINMDENVCELLTQPYCERYRQNTLCTSNETSYIKKHYVEESIINPLNTRVTYKDFPTTCLDMTEGQDLDTVYKIINLSIKIDDNQEENVTAKVFLTSKKIDQPDVHFNTELLWMDANGKPLSFDYTKSIVISRVFEVTVPKTDIIFIKRVKMAVKSFKVDYSYDKNDIKLIGSCFGTLSYSNDGKIKVIQEKNYISIEAFEWILPGNGIFIAKVPI